MGRRTWASRGIHNKDEGGRQSLLSKNARQAERGAGTWQHLWDKKGHKEAWHEVHVLREQRLNAREFQQGRAHISLQASEDRKNMRHELRWSSEEACVTFWEEPEQAVQCVKPKRRRQIRVRKISRGCMTPHMLVAGSWVMLSAMSQKKAWRKGTGRTRVTCEEFLSNPDAWEGLS